MLEKHTNWYGSLHLLDKRLLNILQQQFQVLKNFLVLLRSSTGLLREYSHCYLFRLDHQHKEHKKVLLTTLDELLNRHF
jgi:hypothetical protein